MEKELQIRGSNIETVKATEKDTAMNRNSSSFDMSTDTFSPEQVASERGVFIMRVYGHLLGAFQFGGDDVDKPTNHLDLETKEMLVAALPRQFLIDGDRGFRGQGHGAN